jgi:hypothetical protein
VPREVTRAVARVVTLERIMAATRYDYESSLEDAVPDLIMEAVEVAAPLIVAAQLDRLIADPDGTAYADLTACLAAADLGWSHEHGDPPANPDYIQRLAFQVMAFQPPLIAGVYVDDATLNRMRGRLHGDRCDCGEWDSHSAEYIDQMDATIHAVLYPLRHPVRIHVTPAGPGTEGGSDDDPAPTLRRWVHGDTKPPRITPREARDTGVGLRNDDGRTWHWRDGGWQLDGKRDARKRADGYDRGIRYAFWALVERHGPLTEVPCDV